MNILHLNTLQTGGAALCAMRINNALQEEGADSRMLFAEDLSLPEGITGAIAEQDKSIWYAHPWMLRFKYQVVKLPFWTVRDHEKMEIVLRRKNEELTKKLYLHGPSSRYKNIAYHPLVDWADVVHLHWVANFVDYPTFFRNVKKPIVWTLHDKFPASGALHLESDHYPVPDSLKDIDNYCRKIKRESILKSNNLNIVAISELMVDECKKSDVLKGFPVTLIHNGVDTEVFHLNNKSAARKELELSEDAKVFLFSANNIYDDNKGFHRLVDAIESLNISNAMLVCIGIFNPSVKKPKASFPIVCTGYIDEQSLLAKYYSSADYYLQCSYTESFGQTIVEAMACGTPVISTKCGVASELIQPFNGVLCGGFDSGALAHAIEIALAQDYDPNSIRRYILDNYQYSIIARQYLDLYRSIISQ